MYDYDGLSPHETRMRLVEDMAKAKKQAQENIRTLFDSATALRAADRADLAAKLEAIAAASMSSLSNEVPELERVLHKIIDHFEED